MKQEHMKPPQVPTYSYLLLAFGLGALAISCFVVYASATKMKTVDFEAMPTAWVFVSGIVLMLAWAVSQVIHNRAVNRWYDEAERRRPETTRRA